MAKQAIDSGNAYQADGASRSAATAFTDDAAEGFASFTEKRPTRTTRALNRSPDALPARANRAAMTTITSTPAPTTITGEHVAQHHRRRARSDGGGEEMLRDSPAHDIRVASYRSASEADVDAAVTAAHKAFSTR